MIFVFSNWDMFCKSLHENNIHSVTARALLTEALAEQNRTGRWVNLKHDVESTPQKALVLAQIEAKYGHRATYYVQTYLMTKEYQELFLEIQNLGHEVTYHHDVLDCSKGDLQKAYGIFIENIDKFKRFGFEVCTVCQHGNPMTDIDNRDFFRDISIQSRLPSIADMMVNFKKLSGYDYVYVSDVGMSFKIVQDIYHKQSGSSYVVLGDLNNVIKEIMEHKNINYIISSHPHRYYKSYLKACAKKIIFSIVRSIAKVLFMVPGLKSFIFRFSFISKKL